MLHVHYISKWYGYILGYYFTFDSFPLIKEYWLEGKTHQFMDGEKHYVNVHSVHVGQKQEKICYLAQWTKNYLIYYFTFCKGTYRTNMCPYEWCWSWILKTLVLSRVVVVCMDGDIHACVIIIITAQWEFLVGKCVFLQICTPGAGETFFLSLF